MLYNPDNQIPNDGDVRL
jgi:hypothetical protein